MYADDTHLTFASNTFAHLEENMNDDLTKITEWLNTFDRLSSFTTDVDPRKQVEFTKSLGVYIDENLT